MSTIRFFASISLLWVGALLAQDTSPAAWQQEWVDASSRYPLDPHAPLEDYVRYAQLYNPDIETALWRWKAALDEVVPARSWADPKLTMGHFLRSVETRVGSQQQRLSVAQTIPGWGELDLRVQTAWAGAEVEQWRYRDRRAQLVVEVIDAYLDCYYLERAIAVTEGHMQLVAYLEEVVRSRYRAGDDLHGSLIRVQVELGRLEDRIRSLRDQRQPATATLNALLGRSSAAVVEVENIEVEAPIDASVDSLRAQLVRSHPHLLMLRAAAERARYAIALAEKEGDPDLTLGVDYVRTEARPEAGPDSGSDPLVVMATLSVPIWRDKYRAKVQAATARHQAARAALLAAETSLLAQLDQALFQWRESERRAGLYGEDLLTKAEQAFSVTQQSFAAGRSSFFELIDTGRTLLELQLAQIEARVGSRRQRARIERLIGLHLPNRSTLIGAFRREK